MMGLERDDSDQISCVHDKRRNLKVAVANTDDGTGMEDQQPLNRSKKGSATDRLISLNHQNQQTFGDIMDTAKNVISLTGDAGKSTALWYLCIYSEGDVVRAELSCPTFSMSGFFREFSERIIILGSDDQDDFVKGRFRSDSDAEEFDITITRKLS